MRASCFFGGGILGGVRKAINYRGELAPGTEAEILDVSQNLNNGVCLRIRINSGPREGQIGHIYYHNESAQRTLTLMNTDAQGANRLIDVNAIHRQYNPDQQNFTEAEAVRSYFQSTAEGPDLRSQRVSSDRIWQQVINNPDLYQVDIENYDGGPLVPITYSYTTADGRVYNQTLYGEYQSPSFFSLPAETQQSLVQQNEPCGQDTDGTDEELQNTPQNWIDGCQILADGFDSSEITLGKNCLINLRAAILDGTEDEQGRISRTAVFENLYRKLNPVEQRFAAMVFTSSLESGSLTTSSGNLEELMSIMKVLDNRAEYARNNGAENANSLDAALQSYQFSAFNRVRGAPQNEHWRSLMIRANINDHPHIDNALNAYAQYSEASFTPENVSDDIYHYYSTILDPPRAVGRAPAWRDSSREVDLRINDVELDGYTSRGKEIRHRFYRNIPWTFRHNGFRRAVEQEQES